jgi:hypothetical protein
MRSGSASIRRPDKHCKAAGLQSFEFNAGIAEGPFDSLPRQLSWPCRAIFDPIDRTLGNAGPFTKIGLAPAQHGTSGADLGGKELPLVVNAARRHIYFRVFVHDASLFMTECLFMTKSPTKKSPAEGPPGIIEFIPRSSDQGRKSR